MMRVIYKWISGVDGIIKERTGIDKITINNLRGRKKGIYKMDFNL